MLHYTYKTTNVVTGKYYYGRHSTEKFPNDYLGSGSALQKAILKYGKENFIKEIVEFYESLDLLIEGEKNLVTKEVTQDPMCYNIREGGTGTFYGKEDPEVRRQRMIGNTHKLGKKESEATRAKKSAAHMGRPKGPKTDDQKARISTSRKGRGTGERNAMAKEDNRAKVSLSKKGRKRIYREDGTYYMTPRIDRVMPSIIVGNDFVGLSLIQPPSPDETII